MNKALTVALIAAVLLSGCQLGSQGAWYKPWTWTTRQAAASLDRATAKLDLGEYEQLHLSIIEAVKAHEAAKRAKADAPNSRALDLAIRASGNAASGLTQMRPLTVQEQQDIQKIIDDYVSEIAALRESSEVKQRSAEAQLAQLGQQIEALRKTVEVAQVKANEEAARNAELANQLKQEQWYKWGSIAFGVVATIATYAYRTNLFSLKDGLTDAMAAFHKKYGGSDEDFQEIRSLIAAKTTPAVQQELYKRMLEKLIPGSV